MNSPLTYFTDPILRGPTIGCMLMCLAAALVGVVVFLKRQSLLGEALSHAAYPGVIIGVVLASYVGEETIPLFVIAGAFATALLGLWAIHFMESKLHVRTDSALAFVLSSFFGIGLTLASRVQFTHASLYNQIQVYLYGQAATMTDKHVLIYAILSLTIILILILLYKELQVLIFDRSYAKSLGIRVNLIDILTFSLIAFSVDIGIRSVGIVLMSAMLIAPAAAARQYTHKLYMMLILAAFFGSLSGFIGIYSSVELNEYFAKAYPDIRLVLPTGPMIVLTATAICLFSLLAAPERGFLLRLGRIVHFRYKCLCENILKEMWRRGPHAETSFKNIAEVQSISRLYLHLIMASLTFNGWVIKVRPGVYKLSKDGEQWAAKIVRLHRLWEVYLADYLGVGVERVHHNAEEIEHILTPELEDELTLLLNNPKQDPHRQPIPPKETL